MKKNELDLFFGDRIGQSYSIATKIELGVSRRLLDC